MKKTVFLNRWILDILRRIRFNSMENNAVFGAFLGFMNSEKGLIDPIAILIAQSTANMCCC